jgi:pimeloyl-ACP methyl ester carboxylesterase
VFKSARAESDFLAAYDAAMATWPVPHTSREVATEYGSTHVVLAGPPEAPPLVLLHCALMTSAIWAPIIGDLAGTYRIHAVDVIGDVGRTVPTRPPASEEQFADWLDQVYEGLGLGRSRLLAWSFGGWVGTNFSLHHPERVEKLALLAPFKPFTKQSLGFSFGFVPFLVRTRRGSRFFERKMCAKDDFGDPAFSEILYQRFRGGKLALKVGPRTFRDDELARLTMPVLLLVGEEEFLFDGRAAVERAARVLPDGDTELLAGCNHAVVSDRTERVRDRILGFFA